MRSSTSSSSSADRSKAAETPVWRRSLPVLGGRLFWLGVLLTTALTIGSMELILRTVRHIPPSNGFKLGPEWGAQISEARAQGQRSLLLIGDSRASWGLNCAAIEAGLGDPSLTCTNGGVVWGYLPALLPILIRQDVRPRVLAVSLSAADIHSPVFRKNFSDVTATADFPSAINRLEGRVRYILRQQLAASDPDAKKTIKRVLGIYHPTFAWEEGLAFHQTWAGWNRYTVAPRFEEAVRRFQRSAYAKQFLLQKSPEGGEPQPIAMEVRARNEAQVVADLKTLASRIEHVVLFRMPIDEQVAASEERNLDMTRRLESLVAQVGLPYRDFSQPVPGVERYPVSDGSHMEAPETVRFGKDLGAWIGEAIAHDAKGHTEKDTDSDAEK